MRGDAEAGAQVVPRASLAGLAPPLAEVPLPASNAAALLRHNGTDAQHADRPALRFGDRMWTHRELLTESERFAALYRARFDPGRPPHVGLLMDNTPDYVFALCGAGLAGAAVVGLNYTRRGEHLGHDVSHTDVQMVITEPRHEEQLRTGTEGLALPAGILVSDRFADPDESLAAGEPLEQALQAAWADHGAGSQDLTAPADPDVDALWALLFTSGTSAAPKAVRCTQRRLLTTGNRMAMMLELGPEDVGYASMPLFHTNSLMSGFAPALVSGASLSVARRFSASTVPSGRAALRRHLVQLHRQAAHVSAGHARACGRRRQPPPGRFWQRGVATGRRVRRGAFWCPDHRRLRLDGRRHRAGPNGKPSTRVHWASATRNHGRRRGGTRGTMGRIRRRGPSPQRGSLCR